MQNTNQFLNKSPKTLKYWTNFVKTCHTGQQIKKDGPMQFKNLIKFDPEIGNDFTCDSKPLLVESLMVEL